MLAYRLDKQLSVDKVNNDIFHLIRVYNTKHNGLSDAIMVIDIKRFSDNIGVTQTTSLLPLLSFNGSPTNNRDGNL